MKQFLIALTVLTVPFMANFETSTPINHSFIYANSSETTARVLMVVGANNGGKDRQTLRYAVSDAYLVYDIFSKLGGVSHDNTVIATNPDAASFSIALETYRQKIIAAKKRYSRVESLFYYSGHSNEEGIFLGEERVSYKEIKQAIDGLPADVRIIILDSCSSGAFTRAKGGKSSAPFLQDRAYNMEGYAVITSSSSDENSQESDAIKGSFFTYYLASGLRGAADLSLDKKITLNEIYQYTYNATLSRTEKTWGGAQHPHYAIQMSGTGDVILTDIRVSSAHLVFAKEIAGKLTLRDQNGVLAGEFFKPYGPLLELGLETGKYIITYEDNNSMAEATIELKKDQTVQLSKSSFSGIGREKTVARGDQAPENTNPGNDLKIKFPIFGGPVILLSSYDGAAALLMGGKVGVTINKWFSIGGEGYGLLAPLKGPGYGGLFFQFNVVPLKMLQLSASLLLGAGNWTVIQNPSTQNIPDITASSHQFWIAEPGIQLYINITQNFMIGTGISYRYILPGASTFPELTKFQGLSGGLLIFWGRF